MSKTGGILMVSKPIDVEVDMDPSFETDIMSYVETEEETNSFQKEHLIDMIVIDHSTFKF